MASRPDAPDETVPLLRPMSQASVGTLCIFAVAGGLTAGWCIMDGWNRDVQYELFGLGEVTPQEVRDSPDGTYPDVHRFNAPLLLTFLQLLFMGILFTVLFYFLVPTASTEVAELRHAGGARTWVALVATHVFSTYWLQALMMPRTPLSLGLFAASHALEVPIAAYFRAKVFDTKPSRRDMVTPILMFAAAWLLFYSYSQLSGCLCIWSGYGVELTGSALLCVYLLVLAMPPANFVAQESVMTHGKVRPLLLLAGMNVGACLLTLPIMMLAHFFGLENQQEAWKMMKTFPEIYMLILWLCVQMAATSVFAAGLVYTVNAFWAVALRSLRVIFWWGKVLLIFYFTSGQDLLSTTLPNKSFWSFVMFCGLCFMVAAICTETVPEDGVCNASSQKPLDSSERASTSNPTPSV